MGDDNNSGNRQYGNVDNPSWSFAGLGPTDDTTADHGADMLLDKVDDDADSTTAEQDLEDIGDGDDYIDMRTPTSWMDRDEDESFTLGDYQDDHSMYSDARHVEDASMTHVDDDDHHRDDDSPVVDIRLSDDSNTKMD